MPPTQPYSAPAPAPAFAAAPEAAPTFPPAPSQQYSQRSLDPYAQPQAPAPAVDPFAQPQAPTFAPPMDPYAQQHPTYGAAPASSFGFAPPSPTPYASPPAPAYGQDTSAFAAPPAPEAAPTQQFSFDSEPSAPASASVSLADQVYQKFANMDNFDLVSKKDEQKSNPFESSTIGAQPSLAEMQASNKVRTLTCSRSFAPIDAVPPM